MKSLATNNEEKIAILRDCRYFSNLSPELFNELSRGTWLRSYEPGEIICWQNEPCEGLYIIQKGTVKLFKVSSKGRELVIKVFDSGASFNEVPVFDDGDNVVNVAAIDECEIWLVEKGVIGELMQQHADMAHAVILNLSKNLRTMVSLVEELSFCQVTNRLARLISQLEPNQLCGTGTSRITQDQLAARLGTVREVVARSLKDLERSGAIRLQRRNIQVVNDGILREWIQEPYP